MSAGEGTKELSTLLKSLRASCAEGAQAIATDAATPLAIIDGGEPVLAQFLKSFLLWESTTSKATAALKRVESGVVDYNELRICLPDELVEMIGERYPRVEERALRLRAALNQIYVREHATTLERLTTLSKREAFDYLMALDGVTEFVAARVTLLTVGGHCAPIDSRILRRLIEAKVLSADADLDAAAGIIERKVRAGDLLEAYGLLQTWADEASYPLPVESDGPKFVPKRKAQPERASREIPEMLDEDEAGAAVEVAESPRPASSKAMNGEKSRSNGSSSNGKKVAVDSESKKPKPSRKPAQN